MSVFSVRGVVAFMPKIAVIQCYYYTSRASSVTAVFVTHVATSSVTMALVAAHTVARSAHYDSIVVIDSFHVSNMQTCEYKNGSFAIGHLCERVANSAKHYL